jgi:hypothetical protein
MKSYLKNWNSNRILRLAMGIFIIVQGAIVKNWLGVGAGVLLSLMPIMNIGCCAASGCNTPIRKSNKNIKKVNYEEIR